MEKSDYMDPQCCFDNSAFVVPSQSASCDSSETAADIIKNLDGMLEKAEYKKAGEYLYKTAAEAEKKDDKKLLLTIENELIGFERQYGSAEKSLAAAQRCTELITETGISGSLSAGTILLNVATARTRFGNAAGAIEVFREAFRCYGAHMPADDIRFAGLYNNMASALIDTGDTANAILYYERAAKILERHGEKCDLALTYLNMAVYYNDLDPTDERVAALCDTAHATLFSVSEKNGYWKYTCRKCVPAFSYLGCFLYEKEAIGASNESFSEEEA